VQIRYANAALFVSILIAGTAAAQNAVTPHPTAPAKAQLSAPNADADFALVQAHCSACHTLDQVTAARKTPDEWAETMDRMVDHGMQITPEDNKRITAYLSAHFAAK
jgi:predicted secreted protein